jgi:hypothetical protein
MTELPWVLLAILIIALGCYRWNDWRNRRNVEKYEEREE